MAIQVQEGPIGKRPASAPKRTLSQVDQLVVTPQREAPPGKKLYWIGTLDECPLQNVALNGRMFHRTMDEQIPVVGSRLPRRITRRGDVVALSPEEFEAIKAKARKRRVRRIGRTAVVVDRSAGGFPDEPIGAYIYCLPIDDAVSHLGPAWRDAGTPPTLLPPVDLPDPE